MIPNVAHFVFGLKEQREPFHFLHYASIESCRRLLEPETIYFHHTHLPSGAWWERIRPQLTLVEVEPVDEVLGADYSAGHVPGEFRYAHHADFIRLDVLIERGGIYADIDTIFVRPFPPELRDEHFVIGREPPVRDERTGEVRRSLCNALLMSEPHATFARAWRDRMAEELNGTWSNHSGFLSEELSRLMPATVRVLPESTFFSFPATRTGLARLLEERHAVPTEALSIHLWSHLWWDADRRDFSEAHAGLYTESVVGRMHTTLADAVRPFLDDGAGGSPSWVYVSVDDYSGYGGAATRCLAALEAAGVEVAWVPADAYRRVKKQPATRARVAVAHVVPERFPDVRKVVGPEPFFVGHTVWDTDRIPAHWLPFLGVADLVVVPSHFAAEAFRSADVGPPIEIVPHVVPVIVGTQPVAWERIPPGTFVFYTIGEWNERKAVFKTIEAYLQAFSGRDDVLLVVKTSAHDRRVAAASPAGAAGPGSTAWAVARLLAGRHDPPKVQLVTAVLTDREIGELHRRGGCFVSLCRCEGWGLGAFDAAAYGNPVVITGYGGQLDYLAGSPYLVDFELVPVEDPVGFPSYAPDQRWAEPDVEHAARLMREIAAHPADATTFARSAAEEIRERFSPAAIASALRAAVERHGGPDS
jgi:glycosyltransferase involved in cell wall biosynthesis